MKGKNIILGITGGIAAYKAAILVRLFIKAGANVQVLMTPLAKKFITPLTLATLSKRPILVEFFDPENGQWNSHVDLGLWADAMVIAPATANTMAKMANGIADNLLLTTYLSARCPVFVAPTMDLDMYMHPATTKNIETLRGFGTHVIEPSSGELASGLVGKGRMEEPDGIFAYLDNFFNQHLPLKGKKVMITAGPTYEAIDPVRFIGNHSSGKMGFALAETLAEMGAEVELIAGPVSIQEKHPLINRTDVNSANEMYNASTQLFCNCDAAIMCAAVSDFTPKISNKQKVKRGKENWEIELIPTKDIAAELGKQKSDNQILVGFALESEKETENAKGKLQKKNLDFIVLNSLNDKGAGFATDTNKIVIIERNGAVKNYDLKPKTKVAKDIVEKLIQYLNEKTA